MIIVIRSNVGISIMGHANYAEHGKDIVCAGVSTLAQTLIKSIEELTTQKITYDMKPGTVHIRHGNLSGIAQALVDSFFIGVEMIATEYPNHVRVQALKT